MIAWSTWTDLHTSKIPFLYNWKSAAYNAAVTGPFLKAAYIALLPVTRLEAGILCGP